MIKGSDAVSKINNLLGVSLKVRTIENIRKIMGPMNNARGGIIGRYAGTNLSHAFVVITKNGKVLFIDTQTGAAINPAIFDKIVFAPTTFSF